MYSSTCFGRPYAHHQELNNCSSSLWFYPCSDVVALLLVVVGPAGWLDMQLGHRLICLEFFFNIPHYLSSNDRGMSS